MAAIVGMRNRSADGWLIPSTAKNQYGERSVPHGKKFGRLKSKLRFPPTKVFHSLRKTFATLLQDSGCPEHIAADILGHEIHTQTYGVYGKGSGIQTRRIWIEKAIRYPIPKAAARDSSGSPETG
jgi:integrase